MLDEIMASGTSIAQWDWRITLLAASLSPFLLTYIVTWIQGHIAARRSGSGKTPPMVPYMVPLLGNLLGFAFDTCHFIDVNRYVLHVN
jgi:hypothetical protein